MPDALAISFGMMRWMFALMLLLSTAAAGAGEGAADGAGLRVVDGDTLMAGRERIRLAGIDAPERGQLCRRSDGQSWACGAAATAELVLLVGKGALTCTGLRLDIYGRRLARCHGAAGDLGQALVASGLATAFGDEAPRYRATERRAAAAGIGIWQNPGGYSRPHPDRRADCRIKGNIGRSGRIYHLPGQRSYSATRVDPGHGERWFCAEADAVLAGWRRAGG